MISEPRAGTALPAAFTLPRTHQNVAVHQLPIQLAVVDLHATIHRARNPQPRFAGLFASAAVPSQAMDAPPMPAAMGP